jgi:acyl dehydratase
MSLRPLLFDDVGIGQSWESQRRTVTEHDILAFAELTGDRNPIQLEPEYAGATPFRRCIAHGLLGVSLSSGLTVAAPPMRTLAFIELREWHFRAAVFPGDTIRVRSRVLEKEARSRGRRGVVVWRVEVLNQHDRVVQEGVTVTLVEGAGSNSASRLPPVAA